MALKRFLGSIISATPPTVGTTGFEDSSASGRWSPQQILSYIANGVWPTKGNVPLYVDDVFSTYLYEGTGSAQTITNGIDLSGEGGLVWIKQRTIPSGTGYHFLYDTARKVTVGGGGENAQRFLSTNTTSTEGTNSETLTTFNSNGFSLDADSGGWGPNQNTSDLVSWTFRKQAGFFDVVTYTGDGTSSRDIAHNLGSKPGFILTKRLNLSGNWTGYHQSLGYTKRIYLDLTNAASTNSATWVQEPTATHFTVGSENTSGSTYVAYLFAHDDTRFGDNQNESIIKCGSFSGTPGTEINLGWEPQWLMVKPATISGDWYIVDNMRGWPVGTSEQTISANSSAAEAGTNLADLTSTGFINNVGWTGQTIIYIAIRRPMKTPEAGTEVFKPNDVDNGASKPDSLSGFPVDMYFRRYVNTTNDTYLLTRLTSPNALKTNGTDAESAFSTASAGFDYNNGVMNIFSSNNSDFHTWMFKRATGFFDAVAYTGDGINDRAISHNLKAEPTLIITKKRSATSDWIVYSKDNSAGPQAHAILNGDPAFGWYSGQYRSPYATSSVYYIGSSSSINGSGSTYIAYLFATLDGVSKVGSYTGTAANLDVDCGFTSGARFILIKRTDSTGDWYVYDSARGIVAGNDPYLLINSNAAEVTGTDYIDPLSSGFTVTSSAPVGLNASGGEYIFLAIA